MSSLPKMYEHLMRKRPNRDKAVYEEKGHFGWLTVRAAFTALYIYIDVAHKE